MLELNGISVRREELLQVGFYFLAVLIIVFDQASKYVVKTNMSLGESMPVIENIFHITYSVNPGAAFGILAYRTNFFIVITIALLVVIVVLFHKLGAEYRIVKLALALQLGGAIGNLIDRIKSGYVVDFFDFRIWPIFNIADMAIVIGVSILIYFILFTPKSLNYLFE